MKKILYIGNILHKHGLNKTTIETLSVKLEEEGYNVVSVSNKKGFVARLREMLWTTISSKKIDFILIDTYSTRAFWYCFLCSQIARIRKIKYIPILHGGNLPKRLEQNPILSNLIFKNAYQNVAPSGYLKEQFLQAGFTNVTFIPNFIELDNYTFKERNSIQPKLLWVRSFASIYNPKMAIEVFAGIKQNFPEATLTMVGPDKDGSLYKCKQLAKQLKVEVCFTGKLTKSEWIKLSEKSDIFINTTNFDNMPISVMEAMALGLAIISTNVGGIPFLLNHKKTSLLVPTNGIEEMEQAICDTIKNTTDTHTRVLAARGVVEQWSWAQTRILWEKLMEDS